MLPSSTIESESYRQLRSWYLARLRKSSLTDIASSSLTPASLIQRDRAALEKLIASSADPPGASQEQGEESKTRDFLNFAKQHPSVVRSILFIIGVDLAGIVVLWLTASPSQQPSCWIVSALLLSSCGVAITLSFAFYQIFATLSAVTRHEQAIADYALDAFWSFDDKLRFTAVSPATMRLWGHNAIELVGTYLKSMLVADIELVEQRFQKANESKFPQKMELQISRGNGSLADIELTVEYSASTSSYFCVVVDITDRKNAERYKQQVMQMLSHDLKSPLLALQFSLALIAKGKYGALSQEGEKMVQLGEMNIDRLLALINQLLDLQRLDANRLDLKFEANLLGTILNEAIESIRQFADTKNTTIMFETKSEISLMADQDRLFQVFVNLLANAIKYTPSGGKIEVCAKLLPGDWLAEVRITDDGPGIAPEHQARIFDQFFRVPSVEAQTEEGTGLGLSIARAIIEAHGGKIGVDSALGKGCSFWCHLPVKHDRSVTAST